MPDMHNKSRWPWYAGIAIVAAIVGALVFKPGGKDQKIEWTTAKADRGRISAKVIASGTVSALVTVQVGSQVSGRIASLAVDFNSPVKKGQVIARIDPQLFEAAVAQSRANLKAAEANLNKAQVQARDAERQAKRADELAPTGVISISERDTTRANADSAAAAVIAAEASVAQARASLNQAQVNLNYTTIVSPTDGTVISRAVDVGQTVAASLQAPVLFTIAQDLRQMQVDTAVAESDIGKLTQDMPVSFTVDAYPQDRFKGKVRQIRNAATTLQNVVTYDAVIGVENPDLKLRPGMTANATFTYADRKDVLRVPNAALRFRPSDDFMKKAGIAPDAKPRDRAAMRAERESGAKKLWVLRAGQPQQLEVKVGVTDGSLTEITEGELKEGDEVITEQKGGDEGDKDKPKPQQPMRMF